MSSALVRALVAAMLLLLATATAHAAAETPPGDDIEQQFKVWEKRKLETQVPARLFPTAAEVRLFAWYHGEDGNLVELKPKGVVLTPAQVQSLRRSVFFTEPPPAVAACCIPRHAFKFYDKDKNQVGTLNVCFECACARIEGETPPKPELMWIEWNYAAIAAIVEALKLPIRPEAPNTPPDAVKFGPPRL